MHFYKKINIEEVMNLRGHRLDWGDRRNWRGNTW